MKIKIRCLLAFFILHSAFILSADAQGTAFNYNGRLNDGGAVASGNYDLRFTIQNAVGGGSQIAGPLTNSATAVSNGVFTVTLDFGGGVFPGADRWLEIAVRTNGGGAFTTLSPRQQITSTPYAIQAANAGTAGSATTATSATSATSATTANSFTGSLVGDVTGTQGATVVGTVGGQSAANVAGGAGAANAATSANTANAIVKRDASGNLSAGTITATGFSGNGANVTNVNAASLGGLNATNFWQLGGNNVKAGQFIGSTNNQALEFKVNGQRALRIEPNTSSAPNIIGGSSFNFVAAGVAAAMIGGGGGTSSSLANSIGSDNGAVGGGVQNQIQTFAADSTIGGGINNTIQIDADHSTIGGGGVNQIQPNAYESTISGGHNNQIQTNAYDSTIGGG